MLTVLIPVFLLIALGFAIARFRVVDEVAVKALSDLSFAVFLPALLFRAMARTDFSAFPVVAPLAYFGPSVAVFLISFALLSRRGLGGRVSAIYGLSGVFANTVMVGIPLVRLVYGEPGLAVLLSVIALHALILMTTATIVIETSEQVSRNSGQAEWRRTLAGVARSAVAHPVILPIIAGAAFSLTGWSIPEPLDATLAMVGSVAPTVCLMLLGASLSGFDPRAQMQTAMRLAFMKSLVHPAVIFVAGRWLFDLDALTLSVLTLAASLPIGANVYLLAQRYQVSLETVSAGATLTTLATALTVGPLLAWLPG